MEKFHPDAGLLKACRILLESVQDPLIIASDEGAVLCANKAAKHFFEFPASKRIEDLKLKSSAGRSSFVPTELLSLLKRTTAIANHRLKTQDGLESDTLVDVSLFFTDESIGNVKLLHFKDFAQFRLLGQWKDEAISMVSHELKNPLLAMKNVVSLLLSREPGPLTSDQAKFLNTSRRSIERLTHLLESILDVSRLSAGKLEIKQTWIDLREFLSDVISSFKTLFNVQRVKLKFTVGDEIDKIYVDASKLEQILINLLSNALKFTHESGRIDVSANLAGREALANDLRLLPWGDLPQPLFVDFSIKDTGIGMGGDTLAHLYTPYYRAGKQVSTRGSHLGLNISKTLVEVQGGTLNVESKLGIGTEVSFCLPLDEKTGYMLQIMNSVKRYLERLSKNGHAAVFYTVGKESSECWIDLCGRWGVVPLVNAGAKEMKDEGVFLWALSEYMAVGLIAGEDLLSNPDRLFEEGCMQSSSDSFSCDGYSVGLAHMVRDGDHLEQLFNVSLKRMKQAANFVLGR